MEACQRSDILGALNCEEIKQLLHRQMKWMTLSLCQRQIQCSLLHMAKNMDLLNCHNPKKARVKKAYIKTQGLKSKNSLKI